MIESYPKIYNLGHPAVREISSVPVYVEEKIDGSQFSFCSRRGELEFRSKGRQFLVGAEDKMFQEAVRRVIRVQSLLKDGWIYRGEYLQKPKHNALAYNRVPANHIMIFDIWTGKEWLNTFEKRAEAARLEFETVPLLHSGDWSLEILQDLLQRESVLGGPRIEGVVVKPSDYNLWGRDGHVLMGKFVSEAFREVAKKEWKSANPTGKDFVAALAESYRTERRWEKAVERRRDAGELLQDPKDIGPLIRAIQEDIFEEESDNIKEQLFHWAKDVIKRKSVAGFAEWYKELLLKEQFSEEKQDAV